jgi:hypothetical protein
MTFHHTVKALLAHGPLTCVILLFPRGRKLLVIKRHPGKNTRPYTARLGFHKECRSKDMVGRFAHRLYTQEE